MSDTNINLDFSKLNIIETDKMEWNPSPLPGVDRRRLEREEAEAGRATSIVRYAPGSSFSSHTHGGGEEYFVLNGTFSDQSGDYGKGYYVRNPPGSSHAPNSKDGCTIFVKLSQMLPEGEPQVNMDTSKTSWLQGENTNHTYMTLFKNDRELVQLEKLSASSKLEIDTSDTRIEILILGGSLTLESQQEIEDMPGLGPSILEKHTWIRLPQNCKSLIKTKDGCSFWSKRANI